MHRPLDPRIVNISLDSNALDRVNAERSEEVDTFIALHEKREIAVTPHSILNEVRHPHTPAEVRAQVGGGIFTIPISKTQQEERLLREVKAALQGNAKAGAHDADATHLAEACKYGMG